ncbi:MAG TPA: hypothetical protein VHA33_04420 [Candidatus Angelobacter sp.]|nr:hypothetical protein [Candidatus Angelobacter sp.]
MADTIDIKTILQGPTTIGHPDTTTATGTTIPVKSVGFEVDTNADQQLVAAASNDNQRSESTIADSGGDAGQQAD